MCATTIVSGARCLETLVAKLFWKFAACCLVYNFSGAQLDMNILKMDMFSKVALER